MKKQTISKSIFIGVFIVDTLLFIYNNANRYFSETSDNLSIISFIFSVILQSIPFIGFIFLTYFIENNQNKYTINKIKIYFSIYVILDLFSGLSYFFVNAIPVTHVFFPFYSHRWMFYIIYAFKYLQYQLFLPLFLNVLIWVGYVFMFIVIQDKLLIFDKFIDRKEIPNNKKRITISFVIGIINICILLTAFIFSGLALLKPEIYKADIPLYQIFIITPLIAFLPFSILSVIFSIFGIIFGKKEKIGKVINIVSLIISTFIIFSLIICMSIFI